MTEFPLAFSFYSPVCYVPIAPVYLLRSKVKTLIIQSTELSIEILVLKEYNYINILINYCRKFKWKETPLLWELRSLGSWLLNETCFAGALNSIELSDTDPGRNARGWWSFNWTVGHVISVRLNPYELKWITTIISDNWAKLYHWIALTPVKSTLRFLGKKTSDRRNWKQRLLEMDNHNFYFDF